MYFSSLNAELGRVVEFIESSYRFFPIIQAFHWNFIRNATNFGGFTIKREIVELRID
jgi:hypothetical protein